MTIKITLAMLMCGIGAVGAAGAAGAATPDSDTPSIALKYDPAALNSDAGARKLYARIESAAVQVCPSYGDTIIISSCRPGVPPARDRKRRREDAQPAACGDLLEQQQTWLSRQRPVRAPAQGVAGRDVA